MKLSVLVPVYNEETTLDTALKRILEVDYPCEVEVVVVDDGSTDETPQILERFAGGVAGRAGVNEVGGDGGGTTVVWHQHPRNQGKGAAIRTASALASGSHLIICDADLEYDPGDIPALVNPVLNCDAEVVYGTRTFGSHTSYSFWYVMGNKVVTMAANVLFNCYISDLETCFKLLPLPLYRDLHISSAGFGMEAEVTGKLLGRGYRPFEVPITYRARSRAEGKKLTWRDGVQALVILLRLRLRARR